jgi:hypothetical protein
MKTLFTLIVLGTAGYLLFEYIEMPAPVPVAVHAAQPRVGPKPTAEPEPVDAAPSVPDLSRIVVKGGDTLTHARVKEIHPGSMVLIADQGLFKVTWDRLPEEFHDYYISMAVPDPTPVPTSAPVAGGAPTAEPMAKAKPQRSALEDEQAQLAFAQRKASLENQLKADRATIDRWYKQSSFETGGVSQSEYDVAQADYAVVSGQLAQLEADGP